MMICPTCQQSQYDGTIFCDNCGEHLVGTMHFAAQTKQPQVLSSPHLTLVIGNLRQQIPLINGMALMIGRRDERIGVEPDIDLTPQGAFEAGVSRLHARISISPYGCSIEDMGSANGTFLNGYRLPPQSAVPIQPGDELCCARIQIRIEA